MKIGKNVKRWTHLKVLINLSDTYTMVFSRYYGINLKDEKVIEDIYNDQLKEIFEREAGMYVSLFPGREQGKGEFFYV